MRAGIGVTTVYISKHSSGCEKCAKYGGKIYVDDVWSGGTIKESEQTGYPLLSTAIAGGLFHPRCKHGASTYFIGINNEVEKENVLEESSIIKEEKQKYNKKQSDKYARLATGSIDKENIADYEEKYTEYEISLQSVNESDKIYSEEKIEYKLTEIEKDTIKKYTGFEATKINKAIRTNNITTDIQDEISILDNAISKAKPLKEDVILHRGGIIQNFAGFENIKYVSHETIMNLCENVITDRAFISTSKIKPEELGRNIIMKIKLPKGFQGTLDIREYAVNKYKYQDEVLLKRNTSFFVNKIDYKNDKYYLDMEVIE